MSNNSQKSRTRSRRERPPKIHFQCTGQKGKPAESQSGLADCKPLNAASTRFYTKRTCYVHENKTSAYALLSGHRSCVSLTHAAEGRENCESCPRKVMHPYFRQRRRAGHAHHFALRCMERVWNIDKLAALGENGTLIAIDLRRGLFQVYRGGEGARPFLSSAAVIHRAELYAKGGSFSDE